MRLSNVYVVVALAACLQTALDAAENRLSSSGGPHSESNVTWHAAGFRVEILAPQVTPADEAAPFLVSCIAQEVADDSATLRYAIRGPGSQPSFEGTLTVHLQLDPASTALRMEEVLELVRASTVDVRLKSRYRVADNRSVAVITEDTQLRPLDYYSGTSSVYTRGAIAHPLTDDREVTGVFRFVDRSTDKEGAPLSMPVMALALRSPSGGPLFLSMATDPFYGMQATAALDKEGHTRLERETLYRGTVLPWDRQNRVAVLEWTDRGADGIFRTFYRTIPEIEPCAPWALDVAMGYYDYNGDDGQGWYHDLTTLAELIPQPDRGKVACCLHGWYDRLGFYCYDQQTNTLADTWTAFDNGHPGRRPIRMSKQEMHRKIAFAKSLGFRVVLYYADSTNLTAAHAGESWCGQDFRKYLYTNKAGTQPAGWTGPCGGGLQLDISLPEVRQWYTDYFQALLHEYGTEVDGFVLDESNYFSSEALCLHGGRPTAYGDQAQMRFIHDLTVALQKYRQRNPDLCLFEGSHYLYGLVTHGSFTDFEGIPLVVNYRNSSIQCCWEDPGIRNVHCRFRTDPNYSYPYGLDIGLTNGWGSDMGPSEMPADRLAEVIAHFQQRVSQGPPRPKIATISGLPELIK